MSQDFFSKQADKYARFRPHYPTGLYEYLFNLCRRHNCAWDAATGNGQVASALAGGFKRVLASDISENQLKHAIKKANIDYFISSSESTNIKSNSVDLITVAQAAHWFDMRAFTAECRRVLKSNGIVAIWMYHLFRLNPKIDAFIDTFYAETLGAYWPDGRQHIDNWYKDINMDFDKIVSPSFSMTTNWSFEDMMGMLSSWSAVVRYTEQHGQNPLDLIECDLKVAWGAMESREVLWPLVLKVYRFSK
ncbi:MAG: methyltransferase domain-containing protein [Francisellaceae bacterium]